MIGWYYLHTNGDLIYKRDFDGTVADIRESTFARGLWPVDPTDRENAWTIAVESLAAGATEARVMELANKWGLTDQDADIYAQRLGCVLVKDGNMWCAHAESFVDLQESPAGFGETKLAALAELCKELGYKPTKMGGASFRQLLDTVN